MLLNIDDNKLVKRSCYKSLRGFIRMMLEALKAAVDLIEPTDKHTAEITMIRQVIEKAQVN